MLKNSGPLSFSFLLFLLLSPFFVNGLVNHHKVKKPSEHATIIENRYTVELSHPNHVTRFTDALSNAIAPQHVKINRQFTHSIFSGVSFKLTSPSSKTLSQHHQALQSLFNDESVLAVYPSQHVNSPSLAGKPTKRYAAGVNSTITKIMSPHHLTQVDRVHKELKYTGKGILVGIIDSGIDYNHPALGGGFGKGFKVRYGADLVGDKFTGDDDDTIIKNSSTPLDTCDASFGASGHGGHGTHVAGIVAAKTEHFTGVAPDATLAAWRVFGCTGGTTDELIIEALLQAEEVGCDIINLSLGDARGWSESPNAVVASRIAERGTHVIIAAGNEGTEGAFTVGAPSTGDNAVSVASFDNGHTLASYFKASHIKDNIRFSRPVDALVETYSSGELALGDDDGSFLGAGCTVPAWVKGKYALVKEGSCTLEDKARNLHQAGALGLVVYTTTSDYVYYPDIEPDTSFPVMTISNTHGDALMNLLGDGNKVDLKFIGELPISLDTVKTVSDFSSVGASYELGFRPHLSGVGGEIYSTLPQKLGSWGIISGTSMAAPYVAGSVALYLDSLGKKKHEMKPKTLLTHFQNYAYQAPLADGPKGLDSPLRQGAGLIQVYDTITQKVLVSPGSISFNDTSSNQYKTHTLTIMNTGDKTVSYHIYNNASLAIQPYDVAEKGYTYLEPLNYTSAEAKLRLSKKSIKVAPGKSVQVKVTVIPPKVDPKQHIMYGGYVQFKSSDRKSNHDISVPYFGLVGKQKDLPVFDLNTPYITTNDATIIYDKNDTLSIHRSDNYTTLEPQVFFRLLTGTRLLKIELLDISDGKVLGDLLPPNTYIPRNTLGTDRLTSKLHLTGYYFPPKAFEKLNSSKSENSNSSDDDNDNDDDGSIEIPNGTYRIRLRALHLFGDPEKLGDYHIWESGAIKYVE